MKIEFCVRLIKGNVKIKGKGKVMIVLESSIYYLVEVGFAYTTDFSLRTKWRLTVIHIMEVDVCIRLRVTLIIRARVNSRVGLALGSSPMRRTLLSTEQNGVSLW